MGTVPTTWVAPGGTWIAPGGQFVVKPTVSCGGVDAARYLADDVAAASAHVRRLHVEGRTVMIQPYQASMDHSGETALIYLGGVYSHAVRKGPLLLPGAGVTDRLWERQEVWTAEARADQLDCGAAALAAAAGRVGPSAYARVDLVDDADGSPLVLELEMASRRSFSSTTREPPVAWRGSCGT